MSLPTENDRIHIAEDIEGYLRAQQHKSLLRFITCGSVDDGKSTLIGRLLYEAKTIFEDQLSALEKDSRKMGTQGEALDFALLVDGLAAEREQGITIDVAYRFFATEKRKFIVADTPGHEQYTRNMVTGASTADAAVILIDARKGILTQTRRHSYLVSLLGIRHVILAINKMDLMDYREETFRQIEADYRRFAAQLGIDDIIAIPLSALQGDNMLEASPATPWYTGPTLMGCLESLPLDNDEALGRPFRLPVQWVNRPNLDFRGFAGTIASGRVRPGDRIRVAPSGQESIVSRIVTHDGDLPEAIAGQSVTLTLRDEIDISRGDLISTADHPAEVGDQFDATLIWMAEEPLQPGRSYWVKLGTRTVGAHVDAIDHKIDVNTLEQHPSSTLTLNEIGECRLILDRPVAFDPYTANRDTGGFIVIDRLTHNTVGAGLLRQAARRASNIHLHRLDIDKTARGRMKGQRPCILWMTGLSGAGKSTLANRVEQRLHALGYHTFTLDGDNVRHGLNKDLGFSNEDREENIRRVAEVAKLMVDAGLITLVSFISPFEKERRLARDLVESNEFFEIHVDAPLAVVEARDPKGLYKKARRGELKQFTGIDSPYEAPSSPDLRIDTSQLGPDEAAEAVIDLLRGQGVIA